MGPFEFHRLADRELNEAAQYYDGETPGLGLSFIREVKRCLQSIAERPEAGVILAGAVRRRLLRRFPYALLYKVNPDGVRILAVMPGRLSSYQRTAAASSSETGLAVLSRRLTDPGSLSRFDA